MKKKNIAYFLIAIAIALLSVFAVINQSADFSLEKLLDFTREADNKWLIISIFFVICYICSEGLSIVCITKALGYKRSVIQGTVYGAADIYVSAITPSASGGQPASMYFMVRDKLPIPVVTVTLILNLIMYTLAFLFLSIVACIFKYDIFFAFSTLSQILIAIGMVILIILVVVFYLLLKRSNMFYKICSGVIRFFSKIHIVKNVKQREARLKEMVVEYQKCSDMVTGKKGMLFKSFAYNIVQRISQFMIPFCVFKATGYSFKNAIDVIFIQCFVCIGSHSMPIPGAMGVADWIMLDGYKKIVPSEELATYYELISRGISFYLSVFLCAVIAITAFILKVYKSRKENCSLINSTNKTKL